MREILALLVLFSGLLGVAVVGYIGILPSSEIATFSTAVLVVVTLYYAILNQGMLREMRRERELSQELLQETRKERVRGDVIQIIIRGIDKMVSLLEEHQGSFDYISEGNERTTLPQLRWHDPFSDEIQWSSKIVDRHILIDIQQDKEELPERYNQYKVKCLEYNDLYSDTRAGLDSYIEDEFLEEFEDKIESIDGEQEITVEEEIRKNSLKLATRVLSAFEDPAYGYTEINEDLLALRDGPFADEVERMEELISEIEGLNEELLDELSEMREEYKSEYNILETELNEVKEETG